MSTDGGHAIPALIASLKKTVPMQLRGTVESGDYLEAVLAHQDLDRCVSVLQEALGEPAKPFDQFPRLDRKIRRLIDQVGGIRREQCLFLKSVENEPLGYATLWPWESDPERVTLKVGTLEGK